MITLKEYASLIENGINNISAKHKFVIHSHVGNYEKAIQTSNGELKPFINGILTLNIGNFIPVENIENLITNCSLEFICKQEDKDEISEILSSWATSQIGIANSIGDTNFIMTPTLPETGMGKNTRLGASVSIRMGIAIQSIKQGLLSNMVKWSINGEEIKVENASISTERATLDKTNANCEYVKSVNSWSTTVISLTMAYSYGTIPLAIANNILTDQKNELFAITRNDGKQEVTDLGQYILTSGSIVEQSEKIVAIQCTFKKWG